MLNLWLPSAVFVLVFHSQCWCFREHRRVRAASGGPTVRVHERKRRVKGGGGGGRDRVLKMMATDAEEIRTQTSPCPIPDNSLSTLSIKITRKNQDRHWKLRFIYLQCCEYRQHNTTFAGKHRYTQARSGEYTGISKAHCVDRHLVCHNRKHFGEEAGEEANLHFS